MAEDSTRQGNLETACLMMMGTSLKRNERHFDLLLQVLITHWWLPVA